MDVGELLNYQVKIYYVHLRFANVSFYLIYIFCLMLACMLANNNTAESKMALCSLQKSPNEGANVWRFRRYLVHYLVLLDLFGTQPAYSVVSSVVKASKTPEILQLKLNSMY